MRKNLLYFGIFACTILLTACSKEELSSGSVDAIAGEVQFYGAIKKQSDILATTRATDDEYITLNETGQNFGTFYIWMKVGSDNSSESFFQPYIEAPAKQGNLVIDSETDGTECLNWYNETSKHTFYAWTQPSVSGDNNVITGGVEMNQTFKYGKQAENTELTGTVIYGTNKETDLEKFIITQKGPISYDEWGQDVALYFKRPIAKITLEGITYIDSDGIFDENIKEATIQFPNMYKQATFKPLEDGVQYVLTGDPASKWIMWNWEKEDDNKKSLYVHPFVLGSSSSDDKVGIQNDEGFFIVTVNVADPSDPEDNHSYVGTLNSLKLSSSSTSTEKQELNAGQCMHLYLIVRDGAGVGGGYKIVDWNEKGEQTLPQYRIPGVYNEEDAKSLLEALQKAATDSNYTFPEGVEDLVVNKGDETNPQYDINLFTHIDWSSIGEGITEINIPDNCTLKGNGYNITLKEGVAISGDGKIENLYVNEKPYSNENGGSDTDEPSESDATDDPTT